MLEGFERHVLLVALAARLPASDPVDREDAAAAAVQLGGAHQVLVLLAVQAHRDGIVLEQVDHRRAVQPHVVARRPDALRAGLADVEAQLEPARLLQALLWQAMQRVEAAEVDEEKLLLEGEVFLQMPVAAKGVEWVGISASSSAKPTGSTLLASSVRGGNGRPWASVNGLSWASSAIS